MHRPRSACGFVGCAVLVASVLANAGALPASPAGIRVPTDITIDGCILPAPDCKSGPNVIVLDVKGEKRSLAVITASVSSGHRSIGGLIDDMTLRPMRVHGPAAVLDNFRAGTHVRLHAIVRLGSRRLLVQSVTQEIEPEAAAPANPEDSKADDMPRRMHVTSVGTCGASKLLEQGTCVRILRREVAQQLGVTTRVG